MKNQQWLVNHPPLSRLQGTTHLEELLHSFKYIKFFCSALCHQEFILIVTLFYLLLFSYVEKEDLMGVLLMSKAKIQNMAGKGSVKKYRTQVHQQDLLSLRDLLVCRICQTL